MKQWNTSIITADLDKREQSTIDIQYWQYQEDMVAIHSNMQVLNDKLDMIIDLAESFKDSLADSHFNVVNDYNRAFIIYMLSRINNNKG